MHIFVEKVFFIELLNVPASYILLI